MAWVLLGPAAMLILMALNYREKTGEGQYMDICQAEILMRTLSHFTYLGATGKDLGRTGNVDPAMAPSGIFKTSDGKFIAVAVATTKAGRCASQTRSSTTSATKKLTKPTSPIANPRSSVTVAGCP